MAEALLFHHALGLTAGRRAFADELRAAGNVLHAPDLFEGRTFGSVADGVGHAERIGLDTLVERGLRAADPLPAAIVPVGFSLGVLPAQMLAQTRPGATGALLVHGCVPLSAFGGSWPTGLPLQIHTMAGDGAQLHLYPGEGHLFTDPASPDHDAAAAALVMRRTLGFLRSADRRG